MEGRNTFEVRFKLNGEDARRFLKLQREMNFTAAQCGRWLMHRFLYNSEVSEMIDGWRNKTA